MDDTVVSGNRLLNYRNFVSAFRMDMKIGISVFCTFLIKLFKTGRCHILNKLRLFTE